jgi:pyocin large subunit-like protein
MSFEVMAWAVKQKTANSGQQLVLLLLANHTNGHTGQCNPSHKFLAEECRMGLSTLKNHIKGLEEAGFLRIVHISREGVSLPNQYILGGVGQNLADGGSDLDRQVGQNLATKQEVKPVIKPNKSSDPFFVEFWKAYPRKTNKDFAEKVFAKLKVDDAMLTKMIQAIYVQNKSVWKDKEQQYIPHPSTWLNGKRWDDEVVVKPMSASDREKARIFG